MSVWVLYDLIIRPELLREIREEMNELTITTPDPDRIVVSYESLQKAERLDSFIREVFRTKGDTLSVCRVSTGDVLLAEYIIPKGLSRVLSSKKSHIE